MVNSVDRDQATFDQVHHAVRADAQPVILAAVERLGRVRVAGQRGDRRVDRSHAVLIVQEAGAEALAVGDHSILTVAEQLGHRLLMRDRPRSASGRPFPVTGERRLDLRLFQGLWGSVPLQRPQSA